jgi:hypothetical protein
MVFVGLVDVPGKSGLDGIIPMNRGTASRCRTSSNLEAIIGTGSHKGASSFKVASRCGRFPSGSSSFSGMPEGK